MNVAVNMSKPELSYYSISKLPSTLTWGAGNGTSLPSDDSRFIVEGKTRVRVLIIGEVSKCFLRGTSNNRGSCSLNVVPLYQAEVERLDDLVRGFSTSSKGLWQPVSTLCLFSYYLSEIHEARRDVESRCHDQRCYRSGTSFCLRWLVWCLIHAHISRTMSSGPSTMPVSR